MIRVGLSNLVEKSERSDPFATHSGRFFASIFFDF